MADICPDICPLWGRSGSFFSSRRSFCRAFRLRSASVEDDPIMVSMLLIYKTPFSIGSTSPSSMNTLIARSTVPT